MFFFLSSSFLERQIHLLACLFPCWLVHAIAECWSASAVQCCAELIDSLQCWPVMLMPSRIVVTGRKSTLVLVVLAKSWQDISNFLRHVSTGGSSSSTPLINLCVLMITLQLAIKLSQIIIVLTLYWQGLNFCPREFCHTCMLMTKVWLISSLIMQLGNKNPSKFCKIMRTPQLGSRTVSFRTLIKL